MMQAALFIIGNEFVSDAEVRFAAAYVSRVTAESDEMRHLQASYLVALSKDGTEPDTSGIAVFADEEAKNSFDREADVEKAGHYTIAMFDGLPVIQAQRAWTQDDAVRSAQGMIQDSGKYIEAFGLLSSLARSFYQEPNTLVQRGPIGMNKEFLRRVEAQSAKMEESRAQDAAANTAEKP